jgi:pyridinium-3,5-bisthiocarboxylic acid mononucleotide nickel chelatase
MKILYFDCFSGASGDMILGALLDAGLPLAELRGAIGRLALGGWKIDADRVLRTGVSATKLRVRERGRAGHDEERHDHDHHHHHHDHHHHDPGAHHPDHGHRSLAEIGALIDRSGLSAHGKTRARELFQRLGEAEAAIHQMPLDRVHLHEVGALDSIIDIVGTVFGLEWFDADRVMASALNVGAGTVRCAHGTFPVPAPATARLLEGVPIYSSGLEAELVTPTGALLVTGYATEYGPLPAMRVERIGYGAGEREFREVPNVLRVFVGEAAGTGPTERVLAMECEIDDMNPQIFGVLMDRLYEAGALDVFYAPVQMKKNRPGTLVTIIADPARREALSRIVFSETTTIGLRYQEVFRERLDRESRTIDTPVGIIRFKIARRGGNVVNASPEFDDCARAAAERGLSIKQVQALAVKAYLEQVGGA